MARESKKNRDEKRFGKPERLADIILSATEKTEWWLPGWATTGAPQMVIDYYWNTIVRIQHSLRTCPVIDVTGAARAYWDHPKDVWTEQDFPNVAPPFDQFFIEAAHPGMIAIDDGRIVKPASWVPDRWGFYFKSSLAPDGIDYPCLDGSSLKNELLSTKWAIEVNLIKSRNGIVEFYPINAVIPVSEKGQMMRWPKVMGAKCIKEEERDDIMTLWSCLIKPIFFGLSFIHCKNVVLQSSDPDKQINRERRKVGLEPFVRYHTVNIEPMEKILRTEGQSESQGLKKAMHICRSYFATYTEEKPLFGKISGTFWVQSHVRGSAKQGVVISDYNVKASKQPTSNHPESNP